MKNWFLLSAALVASISVEHALCAALTGPPCTTGRDDGDRYLHEVNCSMLPDTLSFQYSAFSPASSRNKSCWFPKVYESFWNDASSGDEHEQQQHPVHQATKRTVTVKRASTTTPSNLSPTPEPTGDPTLLTTVHISNEADFALLLPKRPGGRNTSRWPFVLLIYDRTELISDAESDGNAFCTHGSSDKDCGDRFMQEGFIRAAAIAHADDGSWIQVLTTLSSPAQIPLKQRCCAGNRLPRSQQVLSRYVG